MKVSTWGYIRYLVLIVVAISIFVIGNTQSEYVIRYGTLALGGGFLILEILLWRCPSCKGYLGSAIKVEKCNRCGAKID